MQIVLFSDSEMSELFCPRPQNIGSLMRCTDDYDLGMLKLAFGRIIYTAYSEVLLYAPPFQFWPKYGIASPPR